MATGGTALHRDLQQVLNGILEQRYRELPFENGTIVPTLSDLQDGVDEVLRDQFNEVGDAAFIGDAPDIPIVDVSASENTHRVFMIASSYSYTFKQWNAMERGGNMAQLSQRKIDTANRAIAEKVNKFIAYGNTALGQTGFCNNASVTVDNSSFNPWGATPDELSQFFIDTLESVYSASNETHLPGYVELSTQLDFLLMKTRMPDSNITVKAFILQNLPGRSGSMISRIAGCKELGFAQLEAAGIEAAGANKDRIIFHPLDPIVCERHNKPTQMMPPDWMETRNGRKIFPMYTCVTPTIVNHPSALRYIKIAKKP